MVDHCIRDVKTTPTYRMKQIRNAHKQSNNIIPNMIKEKSDAVWEIMSTVPAREPYTLCINRNNTCSGCPLSCPKCKACIHQFMCTCPDYLYKSNFCKHMHACVRYSQPVVQNTPSMSENVEFQNLKTITENTINAWTASAVGGEDCQGKIKSICNTILGVTVNMQHEFQTQIMAQLEKVLKHAEDLKLSSQNNNMPQLGETRNNFESNTNIVNQRFACTKRTVKKRKVCLAKPSDAERKQIENMFDTIITNSEIVDHEEIVATSTTNTDIIEPGENIKVSL